MFKKSLVLHEGKKKNYQGPQIKKKGNLFSLSLFEGSRHVIQYSTVQYNKLVTCHQLKRKLVLLILCSVTWLICSTDSTALQTALLQCRVLQYYVDHCTVL